MKTIQYSFAVIHPWRQKDLDAMVGKTARYNGVVTGTIRAVRNEKIDGKHKIIFEAESDPGQS